MRVPELFLLVSREGFTGPDEHFADLVLAVARGELSAEAIAIWFRQRTRYRER